MLLTWDFPAAQDHQRHEMHAAAVDKYLDVVLAGFGKLQVVKTDRQKALFGCSLLRPLRLAVNFHFGELMS